MKRIWIKDTANAEKSDVLVCGWVDARRDHGKLIFIDLADATGILQVVFTPSDATVLKLANTLRPGDVIKIAGKIGGRPPKMINTELETGKIELQAESLDILNKAETLPFNLQTDGYEINEETRLKYKYLDLRRKRLNKNIKNRHKLTQYLRNYLSEKDFVEVETPLLTKSTPEGARDYVVPARLHPGKFYALPQAPQQFKQLLMVAGLERYFQFAKCLRDEDTRKDRQPEFTQLDMEMSFVEMEDVMTLNEEMVINAIKNLYPDKKIAQIPFPRITYKDAMEKYKIDRPDIRKDKNNPDELAFCWIVDFPFFEEVKEAAPALRSSEGAKKWTFTHNPFSAPMPEHAENLMNKTNIEKIIAAQYDLVLNGYEIAGGSIRNHNPEALKKTLEIMGMDEKQIEEGFGHMLQAFKYGAPPHGGMAYGMDRLIAILQNEPSIREVIAFPKTGDGRDLMMDAPAELTKKQLEELHISAQKPKK